MLIEDEFECPECGYMVIGQVHTTLQDFTDEEILQAASNYLEFWDDDKWLLKFKDLFTEYQYAPSTATTIKTIQQLRDWQESQ